MVLLSSSPVSNENCGAILVAHEEHGSVHPVIQIAVRTAGAVQARFDYMIKIVGVSFATVTGGEVGAALRLIPNAQNVIPSRSAFDFFDSISQLRKLCRHNVSVLRYHAHCGGLGKKEGMAANRINRDRNAVNRLDILTKTV